MIEYSDLTDAELVERVAREVLGWEDDFHFSKDRLVMMNTALESFNPFHDMNDLCLVLEKFRYYQITKHIGCNSIGKFDCLLSQYVGKDVEVRNCNTMHRAVLEAALEVKEKG